MAVSASHRPPAFAAWLLPLPGEGPLYLRVVAAIERAIGVGQLRPGDRLPSHRELCRALGVDLTTVTRAYGEARRRHIVDAVIGRGSFVAARSEQPGPVLDLSMNTPPSPRGLALGTLLADGIARLMAHSNADLLMSYQAGPGSWGDRAAARQWLRPLLGDVPPERVLVAAGAQAGLASILSLLTRPGDGVVCDMLTYPGFLAIADALGLTVIPVAGDAEGMRPDSLDQALRRQKARLLYLIPTIHNPTATTMTAGRRMALAASAARHGLTIVEDDPYGLLPEQPVPPVATLAPGRAWYLMTLAKTLTPGLRVAYAVAPDAAEAERLAARLRAFTQMPPPLTSALATQWVQDGTAAAILQGVRAETSARQALARAILPAAQGHPTGLHVWLPLPSSRDLTELVEAARASGIGLLPSASFQAGPRAPNGIRLSLGAVADRARLSSALSRIAELTRSPGDGAAPIV
ncbi:MAG: PLP-dependent aminotransferase family protein [Alphaproteobacteria bacterium]|nr:PLP-dependent aminotransferase family protein [Alphaproteobacteria bacterium]